MSKSAMLALAGVTALACVSAAAPASAQCGKASWYALHSKTASGERMQPYALTAAHRSLPFGTKIRVSNSRTGKSVVVRINDRGPFIRGRFLDLSKGAARSIGMGGVGSLHVEDRLSR
ncbi:septal ring lytic transglycosylase RlpA family protein [Chenggangzhangella methanolivorans]|uniref:Endolytic peptidoglycan transglycosylase RlpA n=1 Tax=Chenggangzhangella methanolivorans TaxID=1437009 RepID=A0A9E6RCT0_9HYPH|nr:septal ring lytic transglycosylase RlpA family protein [Chenggangzhangella methanolivorans]QZO00924.1 septal ring lytic transglycosylase RlpA family protein [Chenggangzhangella methanolivorans]